jgi:hypothetical protein
MESSAATAALDVEDQTQGTKAKMTKTMSRGSSSSALDLLAAGKASDSQLTFKDVTYCVHTRSGVKEILQGIKGRATRARSWPSWARAARGRRASSIC